MKRTTTEMGMRVSDILEHKKELERNNKNLKNKIKNISKDFNLMNMGINQQKQKIMILEKEKQALLHIINQMREGVDQEVF